MVTESKGEDKFFVPSHFFRDRAGNVGDYVYKDITPRSQQWLLSPERAYEEVDAVLEGHLKGIETSLLNDEKESPVARKYGLESGEITEPVARLLAYVELMDRHRKMKGAYQARIDELQGDYEKEKEAIKKGPGGKYKKRQKMNNTYKERYKPDVDRYSLSAKEERQLETFLFRKAIFDIFSPEGDGTLSLKIVSEALRNHGQENINFTQMADNIRSFVDRFSDYLRSTTDYSLMARYKYMESAGVARSDEDIEVLSDTLVASINPKMLGLEPDDRERFASLGKSFFMFLGNQQVRSTKIVQAGEYPRMLLVYNTLAAAFRTGNSQVIRDVGVEIIDPIFGNLLKGKGFSNEIKDWSKAVLSDHKPFIERARAAEFWELVEDEKRYKEASEPDQFSRQLLQAAGSDEMRIFKGVGALSDRLPVFQEMGTVRRFSSADLLIKRLNRALNTLMDRECVDLGDKDRFVLVGDHVQQAALTKMDGFNVDLAILVIQQRYTPSDTTPDQSKKSGRLRIVDTRGKSFDEKLDILINGDEGIQMKKELILNTFLNMKVRDGSENIVRIETQNMHLSHDIANKSVWFVSPRGDSFSNERDPELKKVGVKRIVFHIDRSRPREHKVLLRLDNKRTKPYEFWIDEKGDISRPDALLDLDSENNQVLRSIMLKRLWVITSGVLSHKDEENRKGDGDEKPTFDWKRAHYRIFKPGSKYTLMSRGAQVHAEEIEEDYGIDIYKEIIRRRKIGTLLPNQFMTFVRESTPSVIDSKRLRVPNELTFNSDWIPSNF